MAQPPAEPSPDITVFLEAAKSGDRDAAEKLLPMVYSELRAQARAMMRNENVGQTLQATALVHEAYVRTIGKGDPGWEGRKHFYAAAAESMRRVLIEAARRKRSIKRGGQQKRVDMEEVDLPVEAPSEDVLAVHEALAELEAADPRAREIVNLRYFAGLTTKETAEVMGLSVATIEREWRFIRSWMERALRRDDVPPEGSEG
ncbi:MAG: sigma-70 family RNA polymerase sigma factor [Planctomycetes bacterium]|nr:sigma-70 family RNA polymerase sigma factor [Planctomycetota bacterium]